MAPPCTILPATTCLGDLGNCSSATAAYQLCRGLHRGCAQLLRDLVAEACDTSTPSSPTTTTRHPGRPLPEPFKLVERATLGVLLLLATAWMVYRCRCKMIQVSPNSIDENH